MFRIIFTLLITVSCLTADNKLVLRFKCVSVPVDLVQKMNTGLFPSKYGKFKKVMTNAEFEAFLKEIEKDERVFSLFDCRDQVISGKTFVVRNVKEKMFPESYDAVYDEVATADENALSKVIGFGPQYGEPRDVGMVIEATPQLEPDGVTVSVDYKPQLLNLEGLSSYIESTNVKMPVLRALTQETRSTLKIDQTILSMCLFDRNLPQTTNVILGKKEAAENCLLLFLTAEGDPKITPPVSETSQLYYSSARIEISKAFAAKLIKTNKKYLSDDDIKAVRKELDMEKATILTVNCGLTQNGSTAITRNVLEAFIPESYEHYNVKAKQVRLPNFGDPRDLGSVLEFTPQIDPDGETVEFEMKEQTVKAVSWPIGKMPELKSTSVDNRFITKNGKVILINSTLKNNGFVKPADDKVVISLFYIELQ